MIFLQTRTFTRLYPNPKPDEYEINEVRDLVYLTMPISDRNGIQMAIFKNKNLSFWNDTICIVTIEYVAGV